MEKIQVGTGKDAAGEYQYGKGGKAGMLRYTGILLEKQSLGGRQAKGHNGKNVERAGGGRLLFAAETGPSGRSGGKAASRGLIEKGHGSGILHGIPGLYRRRRG